jgi:hypothetical protein
MEAGVRSYPAYLREVLAPIEPRVESASRESLMLSVEALIARILITSSRL